MKLFNGEKDGDAVLCILKVGEVTDVDPAPLQNQSDL